MTRIDGELYCSECRDERFYWSSPASRYVPCGEATEVLDRFGNVDDYIPAYWVGTRGYELCVLSEGVYHTRHMTEVVLHGDFRPNVRPADLVLSWVADHVLEDQDDYAQCPETGFWLHADHMVEIEDETVDGGSLWYAPWADRVREYEQEKRQDPYYIQGRDEHPDQIELELVDHGSELRIAA